MPMYDLLEQNEGFNRAYRQVSSRYGKQAYIAPECWEAFENTVNYVTVDLWSLGVVLYILLTGLYRSGYFKYKSTCRHGMSTCRHVLSYWFT